MAGLVTHPDGFHAREQSPIQVATSCSTCKVIHL